MALKQASKFAHLDKQQGLNMTTDTQLIQEKRSEEVPFYSIDEIFTLRNGYTPSKSNPDYWNGTDTVPWFRMEDIRKNGGVLDHAIQSVSRTAIKGGTVFPANSLIVATSATIGAHALITVPYLSNQRFTSLTLKPKFRKMIDMKFAYYYGFILDKWCMKNTTTSSFSSVIMSKFRQFRFPIPPMPVQKAIVRILESFTSLENELENELEKELDARLLQYAHYKDSIFIRESKLVGTIPLGKVGTFIRGQGLQKKDFTTTGHSCIHYGQIYTDYDIETTTTKSFISDSLAMKLRQAKPGDLVIATTSENDQDVCKAIAWMGQESAAVSGDAYIFRHRLNPLYAAFLFSSSIFQKQKVPFITGTKVRRVSGKNMARILVPVPSLERQAAIASTLEQFHSLINRSTASLLDEIEARHKQYEYYRNQLLTFRELHA